VGQVELGFENRAPQVADESAAAERDDVRARASSGIRSTARNRRS
jgi:hypothetical protein